MTITELRAKRSQVIADASAIAKKPTLSTEDRTNFDAAIAQADALGQDIARVERAEALEAEMRSTVTPPRPAPGTQAEVADDRTAEQRAKDVNAALRSYLATGVITPQTIERRDLTVAADGILIPTGVAPAQAAKKFAGSVYDLVNKMKTATGEPVKFPLVNDTGNGFVLNSVGAAQHDPTVAGVTISIDDMRSDVILLENSLLQDAAFDLAGFVSDSIQTRYLRVANQWITAGNTSNVGAMNAIASGITTLNVASIVYDDFVSMLVALDPAYLDGACWTMNNTVLGVVLKLKDTQGRPLFMAYNDGAASGFVGTILGYPVKINPYLLGVTTGNVAVQFGDFKSGYTFREVQPGVMVKRLNERYAELNKTGFVAFARVGGAVTDAGTHPIVSMTIK